MAENELKPLIISDTTLRDGEQTPGAILEPQAKVEIAQALSRAGVKVIEAGFPGSSEVETEAVRQVAAQVTDAVTVAFCRALKKDIDCAAEAFDGVPRTRCGLNIFLATSKLHIEKKLGKTETQLLDMLAEAIGYARTLFDNVAFGAEDASRTDPAFLCRAYRTAIEAGAGAIGFPDTVGVLTPEKVRTYIRRIQDEVLSTHPALLAVHFHNDLGLATADTLAAVEEGVPIVQCTVGGLGERAGNAPLEEVVMALTLHPDQYGRQVSVDTKQLVPLCELVSRLTGIPTPPNKSVVGSGVFATTAGVHQDGLLKAPETYLPFRPETVGSPGISMPLSRLSGKKAVRAELAEMGKTLSDTDLDRFMTKLKSAPKQAFQKKSELIEEILLQI